MPSGLISDQNGSPSFPLSDHIAFFSLPVLLPFISRRFFLSLRFRLPPCALSFAVFHSLDAPVCFAFFLYIAMSLSLSHSLSSAVFPRFPSVLLLPLLLSAVAVLSVHLFLSHPSLYTLSTPFVRLELLLALLTLALLLFLNSRRNELLLRMDFLAMLRAMEVCLLVSPRVAVAIPDCPTHSRHPIVS